MCLNFLNSNWKDIQVSQQETRVFLAILIISGYNPLPSKAHYWATEKNFRNNAIYNAIRRDRFDDIMKYLHFHPNHNLYKDDKYCKLRPLVAHLQQKFISHFVPSSYISHDEVMVEYFWKHSCKQAIRNRSIRFGYKVWCQNTPLGYLITFDLYQDKTYKGNEEMETRFGKCASTVLHLLDQYSNDKKHLPYHIFMDNLFTSIPLLFELMNSNKNGTGTMRDNRIYKKAPLLSKVSVNKKPSGYAQTISASVDDKKLFLTRWKNNSVITFASSSYSSMPMGDADCWSKAAKKRIKVSIPHSIQMYNKYMGGTDRMDENINSYRISIRGKKW